MDLSPIHDISDCYFFCHYMDQICNLFLHSDFHRKCYFGSANFSNGSLVESLTNKTVYFTDEALQPVVQPVFGCWGCTHVEILR